MTRKKTAKRGSDPKFVTAFKERPGHIPEVPPDTFGRVVSKKPFVIRKRKNDQQSEESRVEA